MVEFYQDWCGHCRNLSPAYKQLASAMNGIGRVAAIHCEKNAFTCRSKDVKGYPTLKVYYTKKVKGEPVRRWQGTLPHLESGY